MGRGYSLHICHSGAQINGTCKLPLLRGFSVEKVLESETKNPDLLNLYYSIATIKSKVHTWACLRFYSSKERVYLALPNAIDVLTWL